MKPRLILDRQHLISMLTDDAFYTECPCFEPLQESAKSAFKRYAVSNTCCGGDFAIIQPVVSAFVRSLQALHAAEPANIACVRLYLSKRKRHELGAILIHYRTSTKESTQFKF